MSTTRRTDLCSSIKTIVPGPSTRVDTQSFAVTIHKHARTPSQPTLWFQRDRPFRSRRTACWFGGSNIWSLLLHEPLKRDARVRCSHVICHQYPRLRVRRKRVDKAHRCEWLDL